MNNRVKFGTILAIAFIVLFSVNHYIVRATIEVDTFGDVKIVYRNLGIGEKPSLNIKVVGLDDDAKVWVDAYYPVEGGVERVNLTGDGSSFNVNDINMIAGSMEEIVRKAGWRVETGIGILAFINVLKENKTHITLETMPVAIPIKPSLAKKSITEATITYKPTIQEAIDKKELIRKIKEQNTTAWRTQGEEPPDEIPAGCWRIPATNTRICFEWVYSETLYESPDYNNPLPLSITFIDDSRDGAHILNIDHISTIEVRKEHSETLSFTISIGFNTSSGVSISVPGPGFIINPESSHATLLYLVCTFDNAYNDEGDNYSGCHNFGQKIGYGGSFYYNGIVATGVKGKIWVVKYDYIVKMCTFFICIPIGDVGDGVTTWVVPKSLDGEKLDPWAMVDDTLYYDDSSILDAIYDGVLSGNYTGVNVMSIYDQRVTIFNSIIFDEFDATTYFGVGIPVGLIAVVLAPEISPTALAILSLVSVGISYGSQSYYSYDIDLQHIITYDNNYSIDMYMYKVSQKYYIKALDEYKDATVLIVNPE